MFFNREREPENIEKEKRIPMAISRYKRMGLQDISIESLNEYRESRRGFDNKRGIDQIQDMIDLKTFAEQIYPKLRPAKKEEYSSWLEGYLKKGGKITHSYDYPFERNDFYIATEDIKNSVELYGSSQVDIIVPSGIKVPKEGWGHCKLFFEENNEATGSVPVYSDITLNKQKQTEVDEEITFTEKWGLKEGDFNGKVGNRIEKMYKEISE